MRETIASTAEGRVVSAASDRLGEPGESHCATSTGDNHGTSRSKAL